MATTATRNGKPYRQRAARMRYGGIWEHTTKRATRPAAREENRCDDGACIMSAAAQPLACVKQRKARLPEETPTRFA
ncbi:hypothetical protein BGC_02470 [Burkholderia sp. 3C]